MTEGTRTDTGARCAGTMPRRAFLRTGLTGLSAMGLADLIAARAASGSPIAPGSEGPSMIVVWLWGGPSHLETFDPKPDAPAEYRGTFGTTETNVPGIVISDRLPMLARVADKCVIVRSCAHDSPGHVNATHSVITGYPGELIETAPFAPRYPDVFSVANKVLTPRRPSLPQYVGLPQLRYIGGGHLGPSYGPFSIAADPNADAFNVPGLILDEDRRGRLDARLGLLEAFDHVRADLDRSGVVEAMDSHRRGAAEMLTGDAARRAFDLSREDPRLRDRYGRTTLGQRCLLARRLVEAGVRLVTVDFPSVKGQKAFSWDDHASVWNIFEQMDIRLPVMDRAVSALIEDVYSRGMDQNTLIVLMGEMGRTPRLSNFKGQPGREHWPNAMSFLMAGGGLSTGQVIGCTTAKAEEPKDRRLSPGDVLASWYHYLGIDHRLAFSDRSGRPVPLLSRGEPIRELF